MKEQSMTETAKTETPAPQPSTAPAATESLQMPEVDDTKDATCNEAEETAQQPCPQARPWHFVVITHGNPETSKFWSVMKSGVDQAAEDMRVQVDYRAPQTFDLDVMVGMLNDAVAAHPDGIAISIPNADALREPILNALDAGIPVVTLNSGSGVAEELGVLGHFGQSEYTAGNSAGNLIVKQGAHNGLCLIQEADNTALEVRCQGFADAFNASNAKTTNLVVETEDPAEAQQLIAQALEQDPTIDAILALGPSVGEPALAVLKDKGLTDKIKLAAFDLSPMMLEAVENGEMMFLVDQQPFLQGYLPVMYLTLYNENLSEPAVKITLTGPDIITKENAAKVLEYSQKSLR
jgi:simple sugar transport system substrate-binding protein